MKILRKLVAVLISVSVIACMAVPAGIGAAAVGQVKIYDITVDGEETLMGTANANPEFSWKMDSAAAGQKQTAYRLVVSRESDGAVVWDTGKVESGISAGIKYEGSPLKSVTGYNWRVTVWDKNGAEVNSDVAYFETAYIGEDAFADAEWIKMSSGAGEIADIGEYSIAFDFNIVSDALGLAFGATDSSHFYLWQININMENGAAGAWLRPHTWNGYGALWNPEGISNFNGYKLDDGLNLTAGTDHNMKIEVKNGSIDTYIDGQLVNSLETGRSISLGKLGFRHALNTQSNFCETAYYDNIEVTAGGERVFFEDFSFASYKFSGGTVENGRLKIAATSNETIILQKESAFDYTVETDMTLTGDAAGICFSAADSSNMFMWQFNTINYPGKHYLRAHIWTGGNVSVHEFDISGYFTPQDMKDTERHIKIEVIGTKINTYIDDQLVNSYTNAAVTTGKVGFRVSSNGSENHESAYFDNMRVTTYSDAGESVRLYDFETPLNPFSGGKVIDGRLYCDAGTGVATFVYLEEGDEGVPVFRKTFETKDKTVASARLYATALGVYDVYINNSRVGLTENGEKVYDELKPGWTDYQDRVMYYTYDVTDMISSGKNAIAGVVGSGWWTGRISFGTYGYKDIAFLAKLVINYSDGTSETIGTDTSWKSSDNGPLRYADIWNGETYNANLEADFSSADYDDSGWGECAVSNDFTGEVSAQSGSNVRIREGLTRTAEKISIYSGTKDNGTDFGEVDEIHSADGMDGELTLNAGETLVVDLGQNMVGWPEFTVSGKKNTMIVVRFGEMLNDSGSLSRGNDGPKGSIYTANYRSARSTLSYILAGRDGGETYRPTASFYGFRYMEITATDTLTINALKAQVVGSDIDETGSIETSDQSVNQLFSNIIWGQRGNYLSVPTDCPQRDERLGWTGDTQIFIGAAAYNSDVASFFKKWAQDIIDSQTAAGAYPDVVPASNAVGSGNGAWGDAGIVVPYTLYQMYGATGIIESNYDSMVKYMNWLDNGTYDGPGTAYGDWLSYEHTDSRLISVAYYAHDAKLMSVMADAIGKTADAEKYATLFENIKASFQQRYVRADGTMSAASQTAYLLALKFDLLPSEESREKVTAALAEKIKNNGNKLSTGFVGTGIISQTLSEVGLDDLAYNLLLQRDNPSWLYSVDQGATTIWERWNSYTLESGFGDVGMNSFNHYSYGAVAQWMYEYMAGIKSDSDAPGFKHFNLAPSIDTRSGADLPSGQNNITSVRGTYDSAYGIIVSEWSTERDGYLDYSSVVPANSSATLQLPLLKDAAYVTVNGKTYSLAGQSAEAPAISDIADGIEFISLDNSSLSLELDSGSYEISFTTEIPEQILKGDLDFNGILNVSDVVALRGLIMRGDYTALQCNAGDMNDDGTLNVADVVALRGKIMAGGN